MYINELKINVVKIKNTIKLLLGILGLILFGAIFIYVSIESDETLDIIITFLILTLINAFLIYSAIKSKILIESVYFYDRYFSGDLDGYIYTSEMTKVIGKSESKINSELSKLINKRFLINLKLNRNNQKMQVELFSKTSKCECKNCGAIIDKKVDFTGVCPYCGGSDVFANPVKKTTNERIN